MNPHMDDCPGCGDAVIPSRRPRVAIVGIGRDGMNAVVRMIDRGVMDYCMIVISDEDFELSSIQSPNKIVLKDKFQNQPSHLDIASAQALAESYDGEIGDTMAGYDAIMTISSLDDAIGSGVTPIVLIKARELGSYAIAFSLWPFAGQGEQAAEIAAVGLTEIVSSASITTVFHCDRLLDARPALSLNAAMAMIDSLSLSVLYLAMKNRVVSDFAENQSLHPVSRPRA